MPCLDSSEEGMFLHSRTVAASMIASTRLALDAT
jgi:hypothetical protein